MSQTTRIHLWYAVLLLVMAVFMLRLFYLQIIRHDYYEKAARQNQLRQYEIPPERGSILAHGSDKLTPLVLNELRYTLYADPKLVENAPASAIAVQKVIGGDAVDFEKKMTAPDSRYQILAKQLTKEQKDTVLSQKLKGILAESVNYRTYPQGMLASQLLGFVNDEGKGAYGLEEALDNTLRGTPGQLKAITDAKGVPLAANKENIIINPVGGKDVVLTIDLGMQAQLEKILHNGLKHARSDSGSALIIDPNSGAIKAMANYPTYDPAKYYEVKDAALFTNAVVSQPYEIGSVMKPLTVAAALNQGLVNRSTTYYDPGRFRIDEATVENIEEVGGAARRSISDILTLSLNTGATWLLMQMGGGEINEQARLTWHDYLVNRYQFGKTTGVEQGYEASGAVPDPKEGFGLNIQYANTAFGQGMNVTVLQLGAALSSVINGGTYYQPRLIDTHITTDDVEEKVQPKVIRENVVKADVGRTVKQIMEQVIQNNHLVYGMQQVPKEFSIGGKSGTPQITKPGGGYYEDRFNGSFIGFVGGDKPEYVIVVRVNEPKIFGYAGSKAAAPIFVDLAEMLVNNFGVKPKS